MAPVDDQTTPGKLFWAGVKVFARKGYRDATVREICRQAGVGNINGIHYYFGSKEELYREILEMIFKRIRPAPVQWSEHVFEFSMGGIAAIQKKSAKGKGGKP